MYRNGKDYGRIATIVGEIYRDYDIKGFPIDERQVCQKMGVSLVGYSSFPEKDQALLIKKSAYGFFVPETRNNPPTIIYNDGLESEASIRFTIFHELKHYVCEDIDDADDDLADYFAKYFMCPIPYLLLMFEDTVDKVTAGFGVSYEVATYVCSNIANRKARYGYTIFPYEVPLLEQINDVIFMLYDYPEEEVPMRE